MSHEQKRSASEEKIDKELNREERYFDREMSNRLKKYSVSRRPRPSSPAQPLPRQYRTPSEELPNFDKFFQKIQTNIDREIKDDFGPSFSPHWDAQSHQEPESRPADGVMDISNDLRPNQYDYNVPYDELGWQTPSHTELQENYKTHVTSDSENNVITVPWSPQKLQPTKERITSNSKES